VDQKFAGDELVVAFSTLVTVAVPQAEEVLADQNRRGAVGRFALSDLFVKGDQRTLGGQGHARAVVGGLVLCGVEWEIQHREGEHHLGEVARGLGPVVGEERPRTVVPGIVGPKRVDGDELIILLLDRQLVVVVLRPLLGFVELAVIGADPIAPGEVFFEPTGAVVSPGLRGLFQGRLCRGGLLACPGARELHDLLEYGFSLRRRRRGRGGERLRFRHPLHHHLLGLQRFGLGTL
jgi:hypothetical protein